MSKALFTFLLLILFSFSLQAQRILLNENFETAGLNADSLPTGWAEFDEDNTNPTFPFAVWAVRDTSSDFPGVNTIVHPKAHSGVRSVSIPWRAGDPVADDWLFTDSLRIETGDSLIFWMLLGTPTDSIIPNLTDYIDSMQVHVAPIQLPNVGNTKLATIRSLDSNNVWTEHKFNLSAYAGQTIYVVFRYYMNTTVDGLWCNIDDVFVGNRSAIGIQQIGTNVPKSFALHQNYPNPFNPKTNIQFDLPKKEFVRLIIFNSIGQEIETLLNETKEAGSYKVDFNASNLPSGTYFYRIIAGDFVETHKMVLVK